MEKFIFVRACMCTRVMCVYARESNNYLTLKSM